jgi:hypothetical protein
VRDRHERVAVVGVEKDPVRQRLDPRDLAVEDVGLDGRSRTVSSRSSVSSCGTTPSRPRIAGPSSSGSIPSTSSVPPVGGETQPIIRIVELLPAPFGPRKPKASPFSTSKSIPSTAVSSPNLFTSPRAWISASALMT